MMIRTRARFLSRGKVVSRGTRRSIGCSELGAHLGSGAAETVSPPSACGARAHSRERERKREKEGYFTTRSRETIAATRHLIMEKSGAIKSPSSRLYFHGSPDGGKLRRLRVKSVSRREHSLCTSLSHYPTRQVLGASVVAREPAARAWLSRDDETTRERDFRVADSGLSAVQAPAPPCLRV